MSVKMRIGLLCSGALFLVAIAAWIYQLQEGLILTNMQNSYSWGLYISGLAFFVEYLDVSIKTVDEVEK